MISCNVTITPGDGESSVSIIDSLIAVQVDSASGEFIYKRIRNDTLVYEKFIWDTLVEKRFFYENGHILSVNFFNNNKHGSVTEIDENGTLINYEYWYNGDRKFSGDFSLMQGYTNVQGSVYLSSFNNADIVEIGDTVWVNSYLASVPHSVYRICYKTHSDTLYSCVN